MDLIKLYITQLLKNSSTRLRLHDAEKEKLISSIILKIEQSEDLFPELKQMERVAGLEDVSNKIVSIYKRLNLNSIEFERISYQFLEDRDGLISTLRRFIKNSGAKKIDQTTRTPRRKIVFDDTTSTFYELKEDDIYKEEENIIEEDRIAINNFLSLDSKQDTKIIETISNSQEIFQTEIHDDNIPKEKSFDDIILEEENLEELNSTLENSEIETNEDVEIQIQYDEKESQKNIELKKDIESYHTEEVLNSKKARSTKLSESKEKSPSLFGENFDDKYEEAKTISHEDEFMDFENRLMNNIKLVDEYLFKIIARITDPDFENQLINESDSLFQIATRLDHLIVAKLIKAYWFSLLAIRDKKLSATKNEAELIRSTLIIIVAIIKNKDIELHPYWMNHNLLISKLKDLSYEV